MREIKFRALAPNKKGELVWFNDIIVSSNKEAYIKTRNMGIMLLKEEAEEFVSLFVV